MSNHLSPKMGNYVYEGVSYSTIHKLCQSVAEQWVTAYGSNTLEATKQILKEMSDQDLAQDVIEAWEVDKIDNVADIDVLEELTKAFAEYRAMLMPPNRDLKSWL